MLDNNNKLARLISRNVYVFSFNIHPEDCRATESDNAGDNVRNGS